jgi:hypothetical protein
MEPDCSPRAAAGCRQPVGFCSRTTHLRTAIQQRQAIGMASWGFSRLVDRTKQALSREPRTPSQTVEHPQGLEVVSEGGHDPIIEYVPSMPGLLLLPGSQRQHRRIAWAQRPPRENMDGGKRRPLAPRPPPRSPPTSAHSLLGLRREHPCL